MTPLFLGLFILIAVLAYLLIFRKEESFENKASVPYDITDALEHTLKRMPINKAAAFSKKLDALDNVSDSTKKFYMMLNAFEDLRPYYAYSDFTFDVFMLKLIDAAFIGAADSITTDDEIKALLNEINRLKLVANVTDEMPSEKLLKTKQEASAAKKDAKKATDESVSSVSPSQAQGADYNRRRCEPPCPDVCESDDYIRKDSIPCWNCNLPRS